MSLREAQQLRAKIAELKKKLARKTFELKKKRQELNINIAIEEVRFTALAMKEPADMLEVCRVISEQLQRLKVKNLRNIQTLIIYESRGVFLNYEYYTVYNKSIITEINYRLDPDLIRFADKMLANPNAFLITHFPEARLQKWREFRKKTNQFPDPILDTSSLHYYFYSIGQGSMGITSYASLNNEDLNIFKKFRTVFNHAYSRFKDLSQALSDLINLKQEKKRTEDALSELKATQAQLIQSEKMASLGELTAGIAHEIQNPLNFVNNFSEVNKELIDELKNELNIDNKEQAISIANDIKENEEKINHHGKRADAIVKNMMQHSRAGTSQKELTEINALCDEYLRLSYHGLRAKDKEFNATIKTNFDEAIGNINIIPQDIGRVLLNLYNNAFYALAEKANQVTNGYEPTILVSTKKINDNVEIRVKDNGNGIAQKIVDKIFQPFFTTKPTGQGTGLGLSLSYDIIKAHGGEIKVETREGEGSVFIVELPFA